MITTAPTDSDVTVTRNSDADYQATVLIDAPPEEVFDALTTATADVDVALIDA